MMNCKCQIIHIVIKTHCLSSNYLAYICTFFRSYALGSCVLIANCVVYVSLSRLSLSVQILE